MNVRSNIDSSTATWLDRVGKTTFAWPTLVLAVVAVGSFAGLGVASAKGLVPWAVAIPLQAFAAFASFTPMHDASHGAIAPRAQWIDEIVGWICGIPVLAAFSGLKYLHLEHHRHTNDPAGDPDAWSSKAKSRLGIVARWFVLDLHYLARYASDAKRRPRAEILTCVAGVVVLLAAWVALIANGYGLELLLCWLVPSRLAILMLSIFFDWIPHSPRRVTVAENPFRASNVYEHRWLTPLLLAQNYHLVHHLFPGVPFYRYGAVYWELRDELLARGADLRRLGGVRLAAARERDRLRIIDVVDETDDTKTFKFEAPFAYVPGQFVVVHVPVPGGAPLRRCYSLSGDLAITVKAHGRASRWLHDHARPGTELVVDPPQGRFVLDPASTAPLVFAAAGTGITPIVALVEHALATTTRAVTLVYANRDRAHTVFASRLPRPRLATIFHHDDVDGAFTAATLAPHLDAGVELYSCGPAGFLDIVDAAADRAGIPAAQRYCERFTPRSAAVVVGEPAPRFIALRRGVRHVIDLRTGETVLAAAQRAGLAPRASCEEGYCGTCAAQVVCGGVTASSAGPLSDGDLARGFILPCSAHALQPEPTIDFDAAPQEIA